MGWLGIFALVFAQLAVAAYACPSASADSADPRAGVFTPCDQIDRDQANLCGKHCNDAEQSQASYPSGCASSPAFTAVVYVGTPLSAGALAGDPALAHATGPPLSIRDCRFRI